MQTIYHPLKKVNKGRTSIQGCEELAFKKGICTINDLIKLSDSEIMEFRQIRGFGNQTVKSMISLKNKNKKEGGWTIEVGDMTLEELSKTNSVIELRIKDLQVQKKRNIIREIDKKAVELGFKDVRDLVSTLY